MLLDQLNINIAAVNLRILVVDFGVVPSGTHRISVIFSVCPLLSACLAGTPNSLFAVWSGNNHLLDTSQQDSVPPTPTPAPRTPSCTGQMSKQIIPQVILFVISISILHSTVNSSEAPMTPVHPICGQTVGTVPSAIQIAAIEAARIEVEDENKLLIETNEQLVQENLKLCQAVDDLECRLAGIPEVVSTVLADLLMKET
jgi:hypothetical protein